jgi:hypothetical protein
MALYATAYTMYGIYLRKQELDSLKLIDHEGIDNLMNDRQRCLFYDYRNGEYAVLGFMMYVCDIGDAPKLVSRYKTSELEYQWQVLTEQFRYGSGDKLISALYEYTKIKTPTVQTWVHYS